MTPLDRFKRRFIPEPNSGCWLWLGALEDGYGRFSLGRYVPRAHRASYLLYRGDIPEGKVLDHLCRLRCCVNPDHLEVVTQGVNVERGEGVAPKNKRKTHCPQGHEYTTENTYIYKQQRHCRQCHYRMSMNYWRKQQEKKK